MFITSQFWTTAIILHIFHFLILKYCRLTSDVMALIITIFSALFIFVCLLQPFVTYFYDKKHLRRFANAHPFSGITNSWFAFEA